MVDRARAAVPDGWRSSSLVWGDLNRDGHFVLIGFDSYEVNRADGSISSDSYNFLTGRRKHGASSIDSDQTKFTWSSFARHSPPTLNEIGDGTAFDPTAQ